MACYVYLHGFASSPASTKARVFRERLAAAGVEVTVPALDEGDFATLTVTRQLDVVRRAVDRAPGPVRLMGSSMGAYLAALCASTDLRIESLVLMAPAFEMRERWMARYGPEKLAAWKREGTVLTFHYAYGEERPIGYELFEDLERHDPRPRIRVPALVFLGRRDQVVDLGAAERWGNENPSARLVWLDSGHELTDHIETIWAASAEFWGLGP